MKKLYILFFFVSFLGFGQAVKTVSFSVPSAIIIDGFSTDATGFGLNNGKIQGFIPSGGTPFASATPYILTWTKDGSPFTPTDLNQLYAGVYIVTVKDANGCENSKTFPIGQPADLLATITGNTILCYGNTTGSLLVSNTIGGTVTLGYTYEWFKKDNNGNFVTIYEYATTVSGQTAGVYKVKVKDNVSSPNTNEAWSNEFTITQPNAPITTAPSQTNVSCNGGNNGTITLNITGGTSGYSILWNDNVTTTYTVGQADRTGLTAGSYSYKITDANNCIYNSPSNLVIGQPTLLTINTTQTQPSTGTPDGSITATASGGTAPYTYIFKNGVTVLQNSTSNTIINLPNGTYTVTVVDANGCSVTSSNINLEALSVTISLNNPILCYGASTGVLTANALGGTLSNAASYTYQWYKNGSVLTNETNAALSNLSTGTYKVEVKDSNVIVPVFAEVTLTEPTEISITETQKTNVNCYGGNDGIISISVSGGTPTSGAYNFTVNGSGTVTSTNTTTSISGLAAGNYTITVKDQNCTKLYPFSISQPANPIVIPNPTITNVAIFGQSTGAIAFGPITGGNGNYTYSWTKLNDATFSSNSLNISALKAGKYTLTVKDNKASVTDNAGCIATKIVDITENPELTAIIDEIQSISCYGGNNGSLDVLIQGGVAPYKTDWYKLNTNNNLYELIVSNEIEINNLVAGTYKIVVTDTANPSGPYASTEDIHVLGQPSLLEANLTSKTDVLCFGNTTGAINIAISGGTMPYTIQWKKNGVDYSTTQNLTNVGNGNYTVLIKDQNNCTTTLPTITINQPTASLQITSGIVTNLTGFETNNGQIAVTVSGGAPNYLYQWTKDSDPTIIGSNATITNLAIGTYHLIVTDANGCALPQVDYTVIQPAKLEIASITQIPFTNIKCKGDKTAELKAIVTGGVVPYAYKWFNILTPATIESTTDLAATLGAGTYRLEIVDQNNNTTFQDFTVTEPTVLIASHTKTDVSCYNGNDGTITLTILGGTAPYAINWSYNNTINKDKITINDLGFGSYTATITDANNCKTSQIIQINQPLNGLVIVSDIKIDAIGNGLSNGKIEITAVSGGTTPYTYAWYKNGAVMSGENNAILNNVTAGSYKVVVTDNKACFVEKTYTIQEPLAITLNVNATNALCNVGKGSLSAIATGGATIGQAQFERMYTYNLNNNNTGLIQTITGNTANFSDLPVGNYTIVATDISGNNSLPFNIALSEPTPIVITYTTQNVSCFNGNDGTINISVAGGTPDLSPGSSSYTFSWSNNSTLEDPMLLTAGFYTVTVFDRNGCSAVVNNIEIKQPQDFGFNVDKITFVLPSSASATDGSLHVEVIGGVAPYSYVCKNSNGVIIANYPNLFAQQADFSTLGMDEYTISVTDASGCTKSTTFNFNNNPLSASISQTAFISCNNSQDADLLVTINGGFGTKTISWFKNNVLVANQAGFQLNNVGAGTYYAVIKDFNNVEVTTTSLVILQPNPITVVISTIPAKCYNDPNGTITITAAGGSNTFEYRFALQNNSFSTWIPFANANTTVINNLLSGAYSIQVRDNIGCVYANNPIFVTVSQPQAPLSSNPNVTITNATGFGLSNGGISITAVGGNGNYTYNWYTSNNIALTQNTGIINNIPAGKYYVVITDVKGCTFTSSLIEVLQPNVLMANSTMINAVLCNGDSNASLRANQTGGIAPYTYKWFNASNNSALATSQILSGIAAGSYYVIVTDANNNTTQSATFIVTQPTSVVNSLSADYTLCGDANDWTITTAPSGGTGPYTYLWNTRATSSNLQNVPPATYTVTVTDFNGCGVSKNITITAPVHLQASGIVTNPICYNGNDGKIVITASGGLAPYSYLWDNGETQAIRNNMSAGNYSVTITDVKGCVIVTSFSIINPVQNTINIGPDKTLCVDQSFDIDATIADVNAVYSWTSLKGFTSSKSSIKITEADTYKVVVTNSLGCEATDDIVVSKANYLVDAQFAISSQAFVNEKIVIVDISKEEPDAIVWKLPVGATVYTNNKDYVEISFAAVGEYEIGLETTKGSCTAYRAKKIVVIEGEYVNPNETDDRKKFDITIYPNPTDGIFTTDVKFEKVMPVSIKVFALNNNTIIDSKSDNGKESYSFGFALNNLTSGIYFILFESPEGRQLRKIIIN